MISQWTINWPVLTKAWCVVVAGYSSLLVKDMVDLQFQLKVTLWHWYWWSVVSKNKYVKEVSVSQGCLKNSKPFQGKVHFFHFYTLQNSLVSFHLYMFFPNIPTVQTLAEWKHHVFSSATDWSHKHHAILLSLLSRSSFLLYLYFKWNTVTGLQEACKWDFPLPCVNLCLITSSHSLYMQSHHL